jgi:hypothetical protein
MSLRGVLWSNYRAGSSRDPCIFISPSPNSLLHWLSEQPPQEISVNLGNWLWLGHRYRNTGLCRRKCGLCCTREWGGLIKKTNFVMYFATVSYHDFIISNPAMNTHLYHGKSYKQYSSHLSPTCFCPGLEILTLT